MKQKAEEDDQGRKPSDSRWWEFYFVRYFVGTALGAIVVLFLALADSPVADSQGALAEILKTLKPEKFESGYVAVLTTVGLAFCYVASAPILVFHALRGSLLKVRARANWKSLSIFSSVVALLSLIQSVALWSAMEINEQSWRTPEFLAGVVFLFSSSLIFVAQVFLLWMSMYGKEKDSFEYYDRLVKKRASRSVTASEYVESYRHLREHGNAFFIALLELLLGAALFYSPMPWAVVLMLWVLPAAGVWAFATMLESRDF